MENKEEVLVEEKPKRKPKGRPRSKNTKKASQNVITTKVNHINKRMCQGAHILMDDTPENFPDEYGRRYSRRFLKEKGYIK